MKCPSICRRLLAGLVLPVVNSYAAVVLSDNFSGSSLNSLSPAAPTPTSAAYQLFSSKSWNPTPAIAASQLRFGIGPTTSGHIEAQALFAPAPVVLTNLGDYLELRITFTNTSGLFTQAGHLGLGLYNSGGTAPIAGGMNASATNNNPGSLGGAQGWQGYVARLAYNGGNHQLATRPAQAVLAGSSQDLITTGSSSQSYTGAVSLVSAGSTLTQMAAQLTGIIRITLGAANTLLIESKLFLGGDTNGTLLVSQSASASGANFLTNSFDALAIGWRATANTTATLIDLQSLAVATSVNSGGGPANSIAGMYFQQPPTDTLAGATISPAVTVVATNAVGSPVTNVSVALSLLGGSGPLGGTLSQLTDASGVATFDNLTLTSAGAKQLRATAGVVTATSAAFDISPGPATALAFAVPPAEVLTNSPITPAPAIQVRDAYGNNVATNGIHVTVSLSSGTGSLTGLTSADTDAGGLAAFTDLRLTAAGAKQISANAAPLTGTTSSTFNVTNLPIFIPAFPGAEGAGAAASGGRGGDVYYVTSLANSGAGTLREAISTAPAGGRTILFKVSGNIPLTSPLTINKPNLTVAGQSAPGDGICIQNDSFNIDANNVIVRHLRIRHGTNTLAESDCMWINGGNNIMVDHVSASWSVDEVLSATSTIDKVSVQWCYITEALNNSIHSKGAHGYGSLITPSVNSTLSWHHNLYAHNRSRNPRPGSDGGATVILDFRNNAVYNYGDKAGYGSDWDPDPERLRLNYLANYVIKGPDSTYNYAYQGGGTNTFIYQATNRIDLNLNASFDGADTGWGMFSGTFIQTNTPFAAPALTTDPAPVALQRVLALGGALPWRRDAADQRIIGTVRQHNGQVIDAVAQVGTWPTLNSETPPPDTDNDGMPDWWEVATDTNPGLASDRNLTNTLTGYTRLEDYLNWLADAHALCPRNGQVEVNLRTATGGASNLTYTVANGLKGSVTLLGDGYTTRFTAPADYNGVANFTFIATDPAAGVAFGPVNYALLITTTNANHSPTLAAITNRTVIAGNPVNFTCSATDTDAPPQTVTFALQNAPAGAALGPNTGTFSWRPTIAQSHSTNTMNIIASDNGAVSLSATQSFTITVLQPASPTLQSIFADAGPFGFEVNGDAGPDYTIQASTNLINWTGLFTTNSPALPFNWTDANAASFAQRYFRVLLGP